MRRYRGDAPAVAWLFAIAANLWRRSLERRRVADAARRTLGVATVVDEAALRSFEHIAADEVVRAWLEDLPADQAAAVRERVLEDAGVSRGLRTLRAREENR